MLQLDAIYKAAHVLKEVVRRTDLIYAPQINPESTVYLKPENLQFTGSFKVRGAYYKISQLSDEEKRYLYIVHREGTANIPENVHRKYSKGLYSFFFGCH